MGNEKQRQNLTRNVKIHCLHLLPYFTACHCFKKDKKQQNYVTFDSQTLFVFSNLPVVEGFFYI